MTTFNEREQAFEAKYAHDEEFRFLVTARRDKLAAGWLADRLHLDQAARAALTASALAVRDGAGHDGLLLDHLMHAVQDHGGGASTKEIEAALETCAAQAKQQLLSPPAAAVAPA